jgi:ribosomal protein S18 acetylase RimI-like enzyme
MTDITIRKGLPKDNLAISKFQEKMALETENMILASDIVIKGVISVLESEDKGFYLVALKNEVIIGSLLITYEWSDWRNGWFYWIQSVYVDASFRRQGVYKTMYGKILEICNTSTNCCGIRLYVEQENTVAINTYKNLGMEKTNYHMYETAINK